MLGPVTLDVSTEFASFASRKSHQKGFWAFGTTSQKMNGGIAATPASGSGIGRLCRDQLPTSSQNGSVLQISTDLPGTNAPPGI